MSASRRRLLVIAPGTSNAGNVDLSGTVITPDMSCEVVVQCAFDAPVGVYLSTNSGAQKVPLADPVDGVALQQNKMYTLRFLADPSIQFNLQLSAPCNILSLIVHEMSGDVF
jgi:hypothetical protein